MDSDQLNSFAWDNYGPAYNQQVHDVLGGHPNRQIVSNSSTIEPSYQSPFQAGMLYRLQSDNDVSMEGNEAEEQQAPSIAKKKIDARSSSRAKYGNLDWNGHKALIKSLYIDQNKSLSETMEAMKNFYSFEASKKLYKSKFKEWDWQKNLPADTALFMTEKAKRRKREDDAETPKGVSYKTPKPLVVSPSRKSDTEPSDVEDLEIQDDESEDRFDDDPTDAETFTDKRLMLTWNGHSRSDLRDMWRTALSCRNAGEIDEAEEIFSRVLLGLSNVLGNTNEDTVRVAYNLADLYADSGRMEEAVDVIEKVIQNHINTWGLESDRTQQNVLHAVELLNGWNKHADALGLLTLSKELLQSSSGRRNTGRADNRASKKGKAVQMSIPTGSQSDLSKAAQSILGELNPAKIDSGLAVARTHVAAKDKAAEGLLLAIISQCKDQPDLSVQYIKAQAELLKLYNTLHQTAEYEAAFEQTLESIDTAWEAYEWKEDKIESFDFMEAALQLVANMLKHGYKIRARRIFRQILEKASDVFGSDDERTVWVLITIGLVYQTHMTWGDAEEWFEEAFAAALANRDWGPKDGIVRSLQNAMDHHHFSYVSDEGRPFKTIFGVSGITIRPGRLHLE